MGQRIFLYSYSVVTFTLPLLYIVDYIHYDRNYNSGEKGDPAIPFQVLIVFDLLWFACLALTSKFLPKSPDMKVAYQLVVPEPNSLEAEQDVEVGNYKDDDTNPNHTQPVEETELSSSPVPQSSEEAELVRQAS